MDGICIKTYFLASLKLVSKVLEIFFTERKLIRYYYFVNIYIFYQIKYFLLTKFVLFNFSVIKFSNFFDPFLYMVYFFRGYRFFLNKFLLKIVF